MSKVELQRVGGGFRRVGGGPGFDVSEVEFGRVGSPALHASESVADSCSYVNRIGTHCTERSNSHLWDESVRPL